MVDFSNYWKNASVEEWNTHVRQNVDTGCDLMRDWDATYLETIQSLSRTYVSLHEKRSADRPRSQSEGAMDDYFWELDRVSTVIDAIVGSACVVLMRWIDFARRIAIGEFVLLETKFPLVPDKEARKTKESQHYRAVMSEFGPKDPGKELSAVLAIWQVGNVFKHGGDRSLHGPTREVATRLGFGSQTLGVPISSAEEELREMALKEVSYTLGADSIERMALQLGCGPGPGLMPLYGHCESWRREIVAKLNELQPPPTN